MAADPIKELRAQAEEAERAGDLSTALDALNRAAEISIDEGEVIQAIALCKQILDHDPDHAETLDRIHLLYTEPPAEPAAPRARARSRAVAAPITPDPGISHSAPLEELLLTEIVPGASPANPLDIGDMGIAEIPLPENEDEDEDAGVAGDAREHLTRTPLFGSLDEPSLRALIESVELVELVEGEILFRQGEPARTLYVVAEGAVTPIAEEDGQRKKLAVLEAGSFFGEIGLMTNQPRNATIQAIVASRLIAIDRMAMWQLIRSHPQVLQVMLRFLRDRLVDRLMRTSPFFRAFPAQNRLAVSKLFRLLEARDQSPLIEQGRPAESLYALLSGCTKVIQMGADGDKVLAELRPGQLFGEMSLMSGDPAVASVVASGKCWLLALSRERLQQLMARNAGVAEVIEGLADSRNDANRHHLASIIGDDDELDSL